MRKNFFDQLESLEKSKEKWDSANANAERCKQNLEKNINDPATKVNMEKVCNISNIKLRQDASSSEQIAANAKEQYSTMVMLTNDAQKRFYMTDLPAELNVL